MARFQSRLPASLYLAGPFAMGYTEFYNFLIPLYGLPLGMSAGQIGMLVWTAMALAPVFPLLPGSGPCCCCGRQWRPDLLRGCALDNVR